MNLFKPIDIEIRTDWTKEELIQKFSKRTKIEKDEFEIDIDLIGYNLLSYVKGTIKTSGDFAIVSFKIYASMFIITFSILWLILTGLACLYYTVKGIIYWEYYSEIYLTLIFFMAGLITTQLSFKSAAETRERLVRQIIRN